MQVFRYILEAVHLLANHAWKLLPLYRFDPATALWRHHDAAPTLADAATPSVTRQPDGALVRQLAQARRIVRATEAAPPRPPASDPVLSSEFEQVRWFPLPGEATAQLVAAKAA